MLFNELRKRCLNSITFTQIVYMTWQMFSDLMMITEKTRERSLLRTHPHFYITSTDLVRSGNTSPIHVSGDPFLRESFQEQINHLRQHITEGCLSGIPVGYSTSINECLHEKINDLFAGAKMGPKLAVALLTVFFYSWNSQKKNKINGVPVVQPLPPFCSVNSECKKARFGIGGKAIWNSSNHFNVETLVGLPGPIQRAISMLSLYNTLKTRANNRYVTQKKTTRKKWQHKFLGLRGTQKKAFTCFSTLGVRAAILSSRFSNLFGFECEPVSLVFAK